MTAANCAEGGHIWLGDCAPADRALARAASLALARRRWLRSPHCNPAEQMLTLAHAFFTDAFPDDGM